MIQANELVEIGQIFEGSVQGRNGTYQFVKKLKTL